METTTIIFHTDNGGPTPNQKNMGSNMPLKGAKGTMWEGGVRGAALVYGAGLEKKGYVNTRLMHVMDLYFSIPTLAARGIGGSEATSPESKRLAEVLADQPPFLDGDGQDVWDAIAKDDASAERTELVH
eukprot:Sspe_Gene.96174::Locus_68675_Transcript_1_1_Confidence_1.000_Length_387::g.96174::m.96174